MSDSDQTERDDATFSMFGDAEMGAKPEGYQVLARKYRPRLFEDLIGQEAMVRTLSNAFETGRIAHAFMLTGVRGVGKTTTARLLARGLNYVSDDHDGPSVNLTPPGEHCQAIMESRHPDVLELDAASRTGVADMRELLDGVRYAPVSARYKVYIIDEVHMLSTAAFNALLKTLEEPPPHVKFIFATTEIRKVPVTVLSRCQRFDLKRLDVEGLAVHLGKIAAAEGASVSEEGLALIARAAEGSVRDGLSILDQTIVQTTDGEEVTPERVRDMLGLADRGRLLDVFEMAVGGNVKEANAEVADQIHSGADPLVILKDLLDICADVATAQAAGGDYAPPGPADWAERTQKLAQSLTPAQASRFWQILLSGYNDTQTAPDTGTAARMVVIRLAAAAQLPSPEEAARMIAEGGGAGSPGKPEAKRPNASKEETGSNVGTPALAKFEDVAALLDERRQANLSYDVARYLRPASFEPGKIMCEVKDGGKRDILTRLADFLEEETGEEWDVHADRAEVETLHEAGERRKRERFAKAAEDPQVKAALAAIPGARIVDVQSAPISGESADILPLTKEA